MSEEAEAQNFASGFLWAGLLFLLGFVHPMFFLFGIGAALMAWVAYTGSDERAVPRSSRRQFVDAAQRDWSESFLLECDSPAEVAFLKEAIRHFGLQPVDGILVGPDLVLQIQAEIAHYRVDFLAHDWLVIEVDGAAWHSSPEAQARDRTRDEFFEGQGYCVLRLPAKLVFNQPKEAMRRVSATLSSGKPAPKAGPRRELNFAKALGGISDFVSELSDYVSRAREVQAALENSRTTVETERMLIDSAIRIAERSVELDAWRRADPERAAAADEAFNEIMALIDEPSDRENKAFVKLDGLLPPTIPSGSSARDEIEAAYQQLVRERRTYISQIQKWAGANPAAIPHAEAYLTEVGCLALWREVMDGAPHPTDILELSPNDALSSNELLLDRRMDWPPF